MRKYKLYFDKKDTPYIQRYQRRRKFHTRWKNYPYKMFMGHDVIKVRLFGIFTIYKKEGYEWRERKGK